MTSDMITQSIAGHGFFVSKNKTRVCLGRNLASPEHWASVRWGSPEKMSVWRGKTASGFCFVGFCAGGRDGSSWGPLLLDACSSPAELSLCWEGSEKDVAAFWSSDWGAVVFRHAGDAGEFFSHLRSSSLEFTAGGPEFSW
jgi:hypothetical protein